MLKKYLISSLLIVPICLAFGGFAEARSGYLGDYTALYGNGSCETCHGASKSERNSYGADLEAQFGGATGLKDIIPHLIAIEGLDSDGDGASNYEEGMAGTLPGDASSTPSGGTPTCIDEDGDGYGSFDNVSTLDGCTPNDCNDSDPDVNPGAAEICGDGIDNDCFGGDEACAPVDADGDGYDETVDCDDTDDTVNPGAAEICGDGIDNDCAGGDEACAPDCDSDGDGFDTYSGLGCFGGNDCNDNDASINPDATEICGDGIDNDCAGGDESCGPVDADGDGSYSDVDCNDNDPAMYPGNPEVCDDAKDNDCNGLIDTEDPVCGTPPTCTDGDGDGYSAEGGDCGQADCVDTNADINPGACDIKSDGIDQDCSGKDRKNGKACPGSEPPVEDEICTDGIDNDGDGKTDCADKKDCGKDPAC